jgi:hypothetical protein
MGVLVYKVFFLIMHFMPAPSAAIDGIKKVAVHPYYVSVTEINHNQKEKTLEITCKIFIDDMEDVLKLNFNTPVNLSDSKQQLKNDKLISDYIRKNLNIAPNQKTGNLEFVGYEKDSESVFCYFEMLNVSSIKSLQVSNSLLQDLTDKQINIMHVLVNGTRKSYKLDFPQKLAKFTF